IALNAPSTREKYLDDLVCEIEKMGEGILEWFEEFGDKINGEMKNGMNGNGCVDYANGHNMGSDEMNGFNR
ncbi:30667_t:CDS:1, partial [Racocetra persica]